MTYFGKSSIISTRRFVEKSEICFCLFLVSKYQITKQTIFCNMIFYWNALCWNTRKCFPHAKTCVPSRGARMKNTIYENSDTQQIWKLKLVNRRHFGNRVEKIESKALIEPSQADSKLLLSSRTWSSPSNVSCPLKLFFSQNGKTWKNFSTTKLKKVFLQELLHFFPSPNGNPLR